MFLIFLQRRFLSCTQNQMELIFTKEILPLFVRTFSFSEVPVQTPGVLENPLGPPRTSYLEEPFSKK